jgi:D-alanyl-D-alanine carboxypeptidase (penicillin-binding protein 5/6)
MERRTRRNAVTFLLLFGAAVALVHSVYVRMVYNSSAEVIPQTSEIIYLPMMDVPLNSRTALLIDFYTGEILHYQNATATMYPASLVKMMTALVAIENISDLNEMVFLNEGMFSPIHSANATTAGFLPNDSVRAIDLLFGLLLPSGAECAIGLAIHVAESEYAFVAMMNERANEIGMNNTNFTNTTGLHSSNQVSTAYDMAILLRYALANETFERLITSSRHSTAGTGLHSDGITFHSTLFSRMASPEFDNGSILGGRTGFTSQAGQNLASFAQVNGATYILVTSGAQTNGNHLTQALHIEDAFTMFGAINR